MAMTRRGLLTTTMLAGAAAAAGLLPSRALAFRIEEDEVKERLYLAACEQQNAHDQIIRDLIAQIEGTEGHDQAVETVRAMSCPVCGCQLANVMGTADDPS